MGAVGADAEDPEERARGADFATTRWSLVAAAGAGRASSPEARHAMEELCQLYWKPVHAFVRRWTGREDEAEDLTQELFLRLCAGRRFAAADPERGRFRAYLCACTRSFLLSARRRERAQKRGGGRAARSLEGADGALDPAVDEDAARRFERDWALALLEEVMGRLAHEYARAGQAELFQALRPTLDRDAERGFYAQAASRTGLSEGALRVAAHRLRRRFGAALRDAVRETVRDPADVEDELQGLFRALEP
jgi:RNA polymerase sigma-70 factor (ECF subfamily)